MIHKRTIRRSTKVSSPLRYDGNLFFLILCMIFWLPVGILLLIKNGSIITQRGTFVCLYHGSWGWLMFWGVLFFPIAILLFLIKGTDIVEEVISDEEETLIEKY